MYFHVCPCPWSYFPWIFPENIEATLSPRQTSLHYLLFVSMVRNIDSNHLVGRWMGGFVTVTDINRVNIARKVRSHKQYCPEMFIFVSALFLPFSPGLYLPQPMRVKCLQRTEVRDRGNCTCRNRYSPDNGSDMHIQIQLAPISSLSPSRNIQTKLVRWKSLMTSQLAQYTSSTAISPDSSTSCSRIMDVYIIYFT